MLGGGGETSVGGRKKRVNERYEKRYRDRRAMRGAGQKIEEEIYRKMEDIPHLQIFKGK